jgi:hypothetical protein
MRPERKFIAVLEVTDFCNHPLAQDRGRPCGEHRLGLPRLVDRTIRWLSAGLPLPVRLHLDRRRGFDQEVGSIEILLPGNSDQSKQRIAPSKVSAAPIRCGFPVSLIEQTGQPDEIHSPEAWAKSVVSRIWPVSWSMAVVLDGRNFVLAEGLADDIEAAC